MSDDPFIKLVEGTADMLTQQSNMLRQSLNRVIAGNPDQLARLRPPITDPLSAVQKIVRTRRMRTRILSSELFSDPAWDILLVAYEAHCLEDDISVSAAIFAADVAQTTGLRWIVALEKRGLLYRERDTVDGRRVFVRFTDEGAEIMRETVVGMARMFLQ